MPKRLWMAMLGVILLGCAGARAGTPPQLDRRGYLDLGGNPRVFEQHAKQPYAYLLKEAKIRVMADKTRISLRDVFAVTSAEGRDRGTRVIALPKKLKLQNLQCVHVTPGGSVFPMQEKDLRKKPIGGWIEYTVALPQVEVGSIVDIGYEYELPDAISYHEFWPADWVPVLHARLTAACDDLVTLQVSLRNCPKELRMLERVEGDPKKDAGAYHYEFFDLKPASREALAPPAASYLPEVVLYVAGRKNWERTTSDESPFSKFVHDRKNWNYAAGWDEPYLRAACSLEESDEARELVKSLTKKCTNREAKIAAVLEYVRNEIHLVEEGSQRSYPMPATETFEARSGSANDVAGVAIGMLRLAGVDVYLALARASTSGDWSAAMFSSDQFDRFLASVRGDEQRYWLDPMCRECGLDELGWELRGTKGLLFATDIGADLDRIFDAAQRAGSEQEWYRQIQSDIHNARWTEVVDLGRSADWEAPSRAGDTRLTVQPEGTASGALHLRLTGDAKLEARRALLLAEEPARRTWCEALLGSRLAAAELREYRLDGVEPALGRSGALDTLHVRIAFEVPGFLATGGSATVDAGFLASPLRDPLGEGARQVGIWQPQSQGDQDEVFLELPAGASARELLPPARLAGEFLRYDAGVEQQGRVLHFRRSVTRRRVLLPPASAAAVRAEVAQAIAADTRKIEILSAAAASASR